MSLAETDNPRLPRREFITDAQNAAVRVAADAFLARDPQHNPLVICGATGTGKSHLIGGLLRRWKHAYPDHKSVSTTGADFARAYAAAIETDSLDEFRSRFRHTNLLVIDNLEELERKEQAQLELGRCLDELLRHGRQIAATIRNSLFDAALVKPLISRLSAGLAVSLNAPGLHARREIIVRLAESHQLRLSDASVDLLARKLDGTVLQLANAISELQTGCDRENETVDVKTIQSFLATRDRRREPTLRTITTRVSRYFNLKSADLKSKTRRQVVVRARGVAMYLARQLTSKSLQQVGTHFERDHTTVLHACRQTESLIESDPPTRQAARELTEQLRST